MAPDNPYNMDIHDINADREHVYKTNINMMGNGPVYLADQTLNANQDYHTNGTLTGVANNHDGRDG